MDDHRLSSQHGSEMASPQATISTLLDPTGPRTRDRPSHNRYPSNATQTAPLVQSSPSAHGSQPSHQSLSHDYNTPLDLGSWASSSFSQPTDAQSHHQLGLEPVFDTSEIDSANPNQWILSPSSHQTPGWLVGEDFDMSALNAHIMLPEISVDALGWSTDGLVTGGARLSQLNSNSNGDFDNNNNNNNNIVLQNSTKPITEPKEEYIRRQWFTYLSSESSGHITPEVTNEPTSVDERYREDLSRELQQRVNNEPLPSTDFLVCSFQLILLGLWVTNRGSRICVFKCTLPDLTQRFLLSTHPPFVPLRKDLCFCCRFARLAAFS